MGMLDGQLSVLKGDIKALIDDAQGIAAPIGIVLSDAERRVLAAVLDRQRTAAIVHGGLGGLLGLLPADAEVLLDFLRRACS